MGRYGGAVTRGGDDEPRGGGGTVPGLAGVGAGVVREGSGTGGGDEEPRRPPNTRRATPTRTAIISVNARIFIYYGRRRRFCTFAFTEDALERRGRASYARRRKLHRSTACWSLGRPVLPAARNKG